MNSIVRLPGYAIGEMTLGRWLAFWRCIGARVLLDGKDITNDCRWFAGSGVAECLVRDETGHALADDRGNARVQLLTGAIEVVIP